MKRRDALLLLASTAALPSFAQAPPKSRVWRVGYLNLEPASLNPEYVATLRIAMRELGYVEGRNVVYEARNAEGDFARLPGLARELVDLKVDVIVAHASAAIGAAQKATATIPIVMATTGDPVGSGFVKSLAHPGGNITGLSNQGGETGPKYIDLLLKVVPNLKRLGILVSPTSPTYRVIVASTEDAARSSGISCVVVKASTEQEIEAAFETLAREKVQALVVGPAPFTGIHAERIAALAIKHRLPSIFGNRRAVSRGGLMGYGQGVSNYERAAVYIDRIFRGAKASDLPVEQPLKFELTINQGTARAIGVAIPKELLVRANAVFE
jgi:putative ABC transport system substrate-binding protein